MAMFPKRAGRFMAALLNGLNGSTFTPISAVTDPLVANEQPENVTRTVTILKNMEYVEVQTDASGVISLKLTPSGVTRAQAKFQGVK